MPMATSGLLLYPTQEARDAAILFGIERGTAAVYDSLEAWLATVPSGKDESCAA
jgi:hypothetical protein